MLHFLVIADLFEKTPEQCRAWIDKLESILIKCQKDNFPCLSFDRRCYLIPPSIINTRDAYHEIADLLNDAIEKSNPSDRFVAILDVRRKQDLSNVKSLDSVQGLLILSYPEISWVPIFNDNDDNTKKTVEEALNLAAGGFNPMFDGTGIRGALIKSRKTNSAYAFDRIDVAVSIDEETHFAELTAYTAFRFGYRAIPISSSRLANQILSVEDKCDMLSFSGIHVSKDASLIIFEDGFIEFPDLADENEDHKLGSLRDEKWPLLKKANLRVIATASGPDEPIVYKRDKFDQMDACSSKKKVNITVSEWFRFTGIKDFGHDNFFLIRATLEKIYRQLYNIFAGGLGTVWLWNIIKSVFVISFFIVILLYSPVLLIPSLFLTFLIFGLCHNFIVNGLLFLLGHYTRIRTFFKIHSQWHFYPKMYTNHFPQHQIKLENAKFWSIVRKPFSGIFGLRNKCGLPNGRDFKGLINSADVRTIFNNTMKGLAPTTSGRDVDDANHSAYGMTIDVATNLIRRAHKIIDQSVEPEETIHAAVLSTCAYELLGHKTPALSIEALGLRHYCEVLAECEFPGVRANLDMEDRLVDIHNSMWQICRAKNGDVREEMFESGMVGICDSLSDLLRKYGRNEEAACLSRHSRNMRRLLLNSFWRYLLAFPEWAVRSKMNFCISFSMFLLAFATYYLIKIDPSSSIPNMLTKMYELLFSTQPNMDLTDIIIKANVANGNCSNYISAYNSLKMGLEPEMEACLYSATIVVQAMRQLVLLHIGFLATLFYDFIHRK